MPPPTSRKAARLLMAETDKLAEDERRFVTALLALSPSIARAAGLIRRYAEMVKNSFSNGTVHSGECSSDSSAIAAISSALSASDEKNCAAMMV